MWFARPVLWRCCITVRNNTFVAGIGLVGVIIVHYDVLLFSIVKLILGAVALLVIAAICFLIVLVLCHCYRLGCCTCLLLSCFQLDAQAFRSFLHGPGPMSLAY